MEELEEVDVGEHKTGPPQRSPNAILEEVNNPDEIRAPAEPPSRSRSPSVTMEELEEVDVGKHKTGPPQRNPNAILEEVEIIDGVGAPSPRRYSSVSVEEIGDEDMPEVPL
ncbi:hypothetical protein FRC06_009876 [Ceratobasidium sp. 370]|nr:hypothetical protein FRC06_009876 [Ceratobasidium sp. 370]